MLGVGVGWERRGGSEEGKADGGGFGSSSDWTVSGDTRVGVYRDSSGGGAGGVAR